MKISHTLHFLATIVFFCIILTIITPTPESGPDQHLHPGSASAIASVAAEPQPALPQRQPGEIEIRGEIRPGDTLHSSLARLKLSETVRQQIISHFSDSLDFRRLRPGDRYTVILDKEGRLASCTYESGPLDIFTLTRDDRNSFRAAKLDVPLECRTVKLSGEIQSSLFAAFGSHHESPPLIYAFADIFASRLDFNTETRSGDRFSLLFEKYYKDGRFIGYGRILMARYEQTNGTVHQGFYFAREGHGGAYYDLDGKELGSSFIRSPVPVGRVTSRFTLRRMHPILGVVRPHLGVDLAAPVGTPIMAAADGKVSFVGVKGGFGKQIAIDHANGFRTYYGHLSRFKPGLHRGSRVEQKEIIGYVGSTGLSTGPHLDYRMQQNGTFINPFSIRFKPKTVLSGKALASLHLKAEELTVQMATAMPTQIVQVERVIADPTLQISLL